MHNNETAIGAWYALRRTLVPWAFDDALRDLVEYCRKVPIDEIIVKCDTEEFSHGQPVLEWLSAYQPRLVETREALREIGVVYSLNPWITVGHNDRGRDMSERMPQMQTIIGHRGEQTKAQACPLCPEWREHVGKLWTLYAETQPHVIWIEDDIRTFNHNPARYGCFCGNHMDLLSERIGQKVTREEVVAAILEPGEPHPWRQEWLLLQRDVMAETIGYLSGIVHSVSPETRMGIMSSGPENHVLCGRDWERTARELSGGQPIYSRAPLGNYNEASLRGLYYTARQVRATRACLPKDTVEQTEVENWWFTQYSKSVNFTRLQIATCLLLGGDGLTMNLYDHLGTPLSEDSTMGAMLAESKPFFNAMSQRCRGKAPCRGVRILHHDDNAMHKKLAEGERDYYELAEDGFLWDEFLESLGFGTTWEESSVIAASGQVLRGFSDVELEGFLAGGMLLDYESLAVLNERGLGEFTGMEIDEITPRNSWLNLAVEEWHNSDFGGRAGKYMTMTYPTLGTNPFVARLRPCQEAVSFSRLVDFDNQPITGFITLFENRLGGRVAVFPGSLSEGLGSLFNPVRKEQFHHLIKWLFRGSVPLEVSAHEGVYPLPVRRDFDGHTVVGAANLSLDSWRGVTFSFATGGRGIAAVSVLADDGKWCEPAVRIDSTNDGQVEIVLEDEVDFTRPVIMDIVWK